MKKKEFLAWNERMFRKYNNLRMYNHPNPLIRYTENKRVLSVLKGVKNAERVLDVGCGEGFVLSRINSKLRVGVDISETAIKRVPPSDSQILVMADAEALPFSDSFFDAAVCTEVLGHCQNPKKVLIELRRAVIPEGRIVLSIPNEPLINFIKGVAWNLGLFGFLFQNIPRRQDEEWHLHSFDINKLKKMAEGLVEIERIEAVPFWFLPVRYVVFCRNPKKQPAASVMLFLSKTKTPGRTAAASSQPRIRDKPARA